MSSMNELFPNIESVAPLGASETLRTDARALFELWKALYRDGHGAVKYTPGRRAKIERALGQYTVGECEEAIRGLQFSDWHMGENPTGTKYDDVELILRYDSRRGNNVEKFIQLYRENS